MDSIIKYRWKDLIENSWNLGDKIDIKSFFGGKIETDSIVVGGVCLFEVFP